MQKGLRLRLESFGLVAAVALLLCACSRKADEFDRAMTLGQGSYEKGDATNAIAAFSKAVQLTPESIDARLNLANAYLLANDSQGVIRECEQVLKLNHNEPAAYYLMGCAYLRLNQPDAAIQALQQSQKIDPAVDALNFQLGMAHERAGHLEDAIREFETLVQFEPDHPSAHYQLSRLYQRTGRADEAAQALAAHQQVQAKNPNVTLSPAALERCKYTQPRVAFKLEQPEKRGVAVRFVNSTASAFGPQASNYHSPVGVIDYNHDGRNSLFVGEGGGFRLLANEGPAQFTPLGAVLPGVSGAVYRRCLVGDLNNDRFEDVVVLGEQGVHAFRFATNGQCREVTAAAGLKSVRAREGLLADLDFTGKLDLLAVQPQGDGLRVYRNLGNFYFQDQTTNSGLPLAASGIEQIIVEDWKNEDAPGVFVVRPAQSPLFYSKRRAGPFVQTNLAEKLPAGSRLATGDFNNDLLADVVIAGSGSLSVHFEGTRQPQSLSLKGLNVIGVLPLDYDNDGWLDLIAYGGGIRVWRNVGERGFDEVTAALGLEQAQAVQEIIPADFDQDGDTDLVFGSSVGLQYWRNDGGNANKQLKLQLVGNRSNASGLGTRVQLVAGHWRTLRTLERLPFEIGVGKHGQIDFLQTRWSDLATTQLEVPVEPKPFPIVELVMPAGSCPYLYAWDGKRFAFVTDILGAAPLGLPVSANWLVEQDPEELLALGSETDLPAKEGSFQLRITEELREVLYLDEAKLIIVDHPAGTIVSPTSKMLPRRPFIPHELWTLRLLSSVKQAVRSDGLELTAALAAIDGQMASPIRLREPQLRGLAEPFSLTLDFGELRVQAPLVLMLNGWLRFGGGMANIAGSLDPALPFPFPVLEAEMANGDWKRVDIEMGVPAGKTKTILVDLEGKLPAGTRRLRISTAFELYWDQAQLCEKVPSDQNKVTMLAPAQAELRWHGFGRFEELPPSQPLTPRYDDVQDTPPWRRTPFGWCTRYGPVEALVAEKDNALVLLNGGDEVALSFPANAVPPKPVGCERSFFLSVAGWDKDADFHVVEGWRVEPLPFHGMDDQTYGRQPRPGNLNDSWMTRYNTRWVGSLTLTPPGTVHGKPRNRGAMGR